MRARPRKPPSIASLQSSSRSLGGLTRGAGVVLGTSYPRRGALQAARYRNVGREHVKRLHRLDAHETIRPMGRSHFCPPRRRAEINA